MEPRILCFGEVLWDCLPRGLFLGGAPMNVAFHLAQLGQPSAIVSAIGADFLGEEILRRLHALGMTTEHCSQVDAPTGVVQVTVDEQGQPDYTICEGVAYDRIPLTEELEADATAAKALVFGSLAQRSESNRIVLTELRQRHQGLTCFDINLRKPFDDLDLVWDLAKDADLIKLNDVEAQVLLDSTDTDCGLLAEHLHERMDGAMICLTAGARGAGLYRQGQWTFCEPEPITLTDAVGAGDAFLAGLIDGLLKNAPIDKVLFRASRLAEFVATNDGPTPTHDSATNAAKAAKAAKVL